MRTQQEKDLEFKRFYSQKYKEAYLKIINSKNYDDMVENKIIDIKKEYGDKLRTTTLKSDVDNQPVNKIYSEDEIDGDKLIEEIHNFDIFVDDLIKIREIFENEFFLVETKYNSEKLHTEGEVKYIVESIAKDDINKLEEKYILLEDKTEKFKFPTYKTKDKI